MARTLADRLNQQVQDLKSHVAQRPVPAALGASCELVAPGGQDNAPDLLIGCPAPEQALTAPSQARLAPDRNPVLARVGLAQSRPYGREHVLPSRS